MLELLHLAEHTPRRVPVVGAQEGDGVVTPVVAQAELHEVVILDELVDWHQLDGGDTEVDEVVDHGAEASEPLPAAPWLGGRPTGRDRADRQYPR